MKRFFDILLVCFTAPFALVLVLFFGFVIFVTSGGPIFFVSQRIGKFGKSFNMPKLRSMKKDAPLVATAELLRSENYLIPLGKFMRIYSIDELPQIWCIAKGDMSFVGPRPALPSQNNLIELRNKFGVDTILPGLTGWAQINGRDSVTDMQKISLDVYYLENNSFLFDLKILIFTIVKVFTRHGAR